MSTKIIAAVLSLQTVIGYPQNLYLFLTVPVVYWCRKLEGSPLKKIIKDLLTTTGILTACFCLSLVTNRISQSYMLIPMCFVLGVFLISVITVGYFWGVTASLISVLAHHAGQVMTYSAIIRAVWGSTDEGSIKKLQVNLANIRKKLGERPGDRRYISNELGVGYRMMSDE